MNEQIQIHKKIQDWKSSTIRLKENDVAILNSKLKMNVFKMFSEFVHAWIEGQSPSHKNDEQVERLIQRMRDKGIKDPLPGEFKPDFL